MITLQTWKRGINNGLKTSLMLLKIIIPVYVAVKILEHTPIIKQVSHLFTPLMNFTGLPGEAAIAFVTGSLVGNYAAIGIIIALHLSPWQITTLAIMLNLSHELFIESAVLKKVGISIWPVIIIRLVSAFVVGGLMNLIGKTF